jgi:hypothetical protein
MGEFIRIAGCNCTAVKGECRAFEKVDPDPLRGLQKHERNSEFGRRIFRRDVSFAIFSKRASATPSAMPMNLGNFA